MAATSKDQVKHRKPMTMAIIEEQIQTIKGAVMIVYPMGLPPYDEVEHILNDTEDLYVTSCDCIDCLYILIFFLPMLSPSPHLGLSGRNSILYSNLC